MNILKAIKRSPLGLDLYMWLTYRTFALRKTVCGSLGEPSTVSSECIRTRPVTTWTVQNFRKKCLRELKKIKKAWPEINFAVRRGELVLGRSKTLCSA